MNARGALGGGVDVKKSVLKLSGETTEQKQIELARAQGKAFQEALAYMKDSEASFSAIKELDEVGVAMAAEEAEGMYVKEGDTLIWHAPHKEENVHLEVVLFEKKTGRFLPHIDVEMEIKEEKSGEMVGRHMQPFLWHPWLAHYGRNWSIPRKGAYSVVVRAKAPTFMRHDKENGRFFSKDIEVTFESVPLPMGQKT